MITHFVFLTDFFLPWLQFNFGNTFYLCSSRGCDVNFYVLERQCWCLCGIVSAVTVTDYGRAAPQDSSCQLIPAVAQATLRPQWIVPVQDSSRGSFYPASPAPDNNVLTRLQHDRSASVADYKALFQTLVHGIKWMKRAQKGINLVWLEAGLMMFRNTLWPQLEFSLECMKWYEQN